MKRNKQVVFSRDGELVVDRDFLDKVIAKGMKKVSEKMMDDITKRYNLEVARFEMRQLRRYIENSKKVL